MVDYQEVIPDSQDEAEMGDFELQLDVNLTASDSPEPHPLSNASLSCLNPSSSSSFIFPLTMSRSNPTAEVSTISQFTASSTQTARTEDVSKFTEPSVDSPKPLNVSDLTSVTSPSHLVTSKHRPKPRPKFANNGNKDKGVNDSSNAHSPIVEPSTFSIDITERIKMRRSGGGDPSYAKEKAAARKSKDVIVLDNDEDLNLSGPKQALAFSSLGKPKGDPEVGIDGVLTTNTSNQANKSNVGRPKKRGKTEVFGSGDNTPTEKRKKKNTATDEGKGDSSGERLKKKKLKPMAEDERGTQPEKVKKKEKNKSQKPDQSRKPSSDDGELPQFKSREFVLDSDDELRLVEEDSPSAPVMAPASDKAASPMIHNLGTQRVSSLIIDRMSPLSSLSDEGEEASTKIIAASAFSEKKTKKDKKKKRGSVDSDEDKENSGRDSETLDNRPPPKKAKRNKEPPKGKDTPIASDLITRDMDTDKRAASKSEHPAVVKKKKGRRVVVDDDDDEDIDPGKASETGPPTIEIEAPLLPTRKLVSRSSLPHPPKNRPLVALLQRVNSDSPRRRFSPAVARSFLTHIAPLHPNRRPPPPPPPRIIPKKTKKELAREEKWEEELQDTVSGWCELDESERDRLRREKRDWELGLIED